VHDHRGHFVGDNGALFEVVSVASGKLLHEAISFTFDGPKRLALKAKVSIAGERAGAFDMQGTKG